MTTFPFFFCGIFRLLLLVNLFLRPSTHTHLHLQNKHRSTDRQQPIEHQQVVSVPALKTRLQPGRAANSIRTVNPRRKYNLRTISSYLLGSVVEFFCIILSNETLCVLRRKGISFIMRLCSVKLHITSTAKNHRLKSGLPISNFDYLILKSLLKIKVLVSHRRKKCKFR